MYGVVNVSMSNQHVQLCLLLYFTTNLALSLYLNLSLCHSVWLSLSLSGIVAPGKVRHFLLPSQEL